MEIKFHLILLFTLINCNLFSQSGFKGGMNMSNYYGSGANTDGSGHDFVTGINVGYFKDWDLRNDSLKNYFVSIGFEINLMTKGSVIRNYRYYSEVGYPSVVWQVKDKKEFYYGIELPLIIKVAKWINEFIQIKFQFGGTLSSLLPFYYMDDPSPLNLTDVSGLLGLEISFKDLLFNIRYTRGFIEIYHLAYSHTITFSFGYVL